MTRHKHAQTGLVTPQPPQLLLIAVLRAFAMLVHYVVSTFQMKQLRPKRDWHTTDDEVALPRVKTDTQQQETIAVPHDGPIALILSSTLRVRPSKDEGVLTTVSHTAPSPSVARASYAIHLPLLRMGRQDQSNEGELPPSVRSTGGVRSGREADELVQWTNSSDERPKRKRRASVRALARMTQGALRPTPNKNAVA